MKEKRIALFARTTRDETYIYQLIVRLVEMVQETLQPEQIYGSNQRPTKEEITRGSSVGKNRFVKPPEAFGVLLEHLTKINVVSGRGEQ